MNPKNSYGIVFGIAKIHLPGNYPIFIPLCPRQNYVKWPMKLGVYTKNCRPHAKFLTKTLRRLLSIVYCNIAGFEYCKALFLRSTQQLSSTADMRRHNHQLHYRLRWQQNFIHNGKKKCFFRKDAIWYFHYSKNNIQSNPLSCMKFSAQKQIIMKRSEHSSKGLIILNKQSLPHFSLVWLIPDSVLH